MLGLGGAFAAWVPRMFGTAVWVNTDGIEWKRSKFTWPQRAYLALAEGLSVLFASRILADSTAIAEYLRRRYPGLTKVSTIAYGANIPTAIPDPSLVDEWQLKPNAYYLVVCRLEPENHVLEIVEGFEKSHCSAPLVILGDIENPNPYVQRLLENGSRRIRFVGTVYDKDRLAALRFHSRAYIHGHSVGGTNPSLLEAMSCSNLVIAHDNPFNREVLGPHGLYFITTSELSSHIDDIEAERIEVEARRIALTDRIRERYRWDHIADAYENLLKDDS